MAALQVGKPAPDFTLEGPEWHGVGPEQVIDSERK
jgi:hypothetical protein